MQIAHCSVKHGAKHYHSVRRINVSAAEIQVLQAIHGNDAVENVVFAGESDRSAAEEMDHLKRIYGGKQETLAIVDRLFPGAKPTLPETLAEVGFPDVDCSKPAKVAAEKPKEGEIIAPPSRKILKAASGEAALA